MADYQLPPENPQIPITGRDTCIIERCHRCGSPLFKSWDEIICLCCGTVDYLAPVSSCGRATTRNLGGRNLRGRNLRPRGQVNNSKAMLASWQRRRESRSTH